PAERVALLTRFFTHLEANAEDLWGVPAFSDDAAPEQAKESSPNDETYGAAYEEMSYRDSTDDGEEGSVAGSGPREYFSLDEEAQALESRLEFLTTVATLWQDAAPFLRRHLNDSSLAEAVSGWLEAARAWQSP